jgi:hypothetical protein
MQRRAQLRKIKAWILDQEEEKHQRLPELRLEFNRLIYSDSTSSAHRRWEWDAKDRRYLLLAGGKPPGCHTWNTQDREFKKTLKDRRNENGEKLGKHEKEKLMCEEHGYVYTRGKNEDYPRCGQCWCCIPEDQIPKEDETKKKKTDTKPTTDEKKEKKKKKPTTTSGEKKAKDEIKKKKEAAKKAKEDQKKKDKAKKEAEKEDKKKKDKAKIEADKKTKEDKKKKDKAKIEADKKAKEDQKKKDKAKIEADKKAKAKIEADKKAKKEAVLKKAHNKKLQAFCIKGGKDKHGNTWKIMKNLKLRQTSGELVFVR